VGSITEPAGTAWSARTEGSISLGSTATAPDFTATALCPVPEERRTNSVPRTPQTMEGSRHGETLTLNKFADLAQNGSRGQAMPIELLPDDRSITEISWMVSSWILTTAHPGN
jgi:hypothetical protein